jgi:hypothetical protein
LQEETRADQFSRDRTGIDDPDAGNNSIESPRLRHPVTQAAKEGSAVVAAIVVLLLILVLFGVGFAVKALLWVALALFVLWLIGFFIGAGAASAEGRRRWYYW